MGQEKHGEHSRGLRQWLMQPQQLPQRLLLHPALLRVR